MPRDFRRRPLPAWLAHPLRWQRLPVPWAAVARGALAAGPLLGVGIGTGHPAAGVLAALGAMLAGVNDRPGTRRNGIVHIGLPALAGTAGVLLGGTAATVAAGWWAIPVIFVVGLVSGAVSVVGPVCSTAGMQLLVAVIIGMGMPLPGPAWFKALCFLGGAGWLLLLRLVLRPPGTLDGGRATLATVFDALADALAAVGTPGAVPARRRLTAALDRAEEAMRLHRLFRRLLTPGDRLLIERYAAATALCEAAVALLWEARPLPPRVSDGPRRLATAIRTHSPAGPLPAPGASTAARAAFDRALLDAAVVFARTTPEHSAADLPSAPARSRVRWRVLGAAGREYALRVALCVAASASVALALRANHWYWLPATAAFLVKPDMGPLFSRVVNRFVGTAVGVLVFAGLAAAFGGGWWPAVAAAAGGALVPVATRHFALQTAVVTVLVLSFVSVGGDTQAAGNRLADTVIACGIVLLIGHLPRLVDPAARAGLRVGTALRCTERYLDHILTVSASERSGERMALRRAAYRALAEARATADTAAAELGRTVDWVPVVAAAERIVDAATACAVRIEHGAPRPSEREAREVTGVLTALAATLDGTGGPTVQEFITAPECETLADVVAELRRIRAAAA
ncbi:FUSC family protein [Actinacidiphila oryziradicis]|uniref:FUSC family protein n=1 Tax=Actinacidiphila oryziradicis TaxID=2571141 RepID=A0A4U0SPN7_9ACTN|nr:FUSC family protein [Actinacidiphila oryziradicis]TKA12014.1 FUSC family protein [Actinacidiphila oryziradicis]